MPQPPLLPEETLIRVLRVARVDGAGALVLGGIFALLAAAGGERAFAVIGLLASGAGAVELHGVSLLRRGDPGGMNWLIGSQPLLLAVILGYCALRLWVVELPPVPEDFQGVFAASAQQWDMSLADYQRALNQITIAVLALVAVGFQGGMLWYYVRRRTPVSLALAE